MPNDKLTRLLEKNLVMTEEIHEIVKKIRRHMIIVQVIGVIKIILIIAPIIFAIIYLPPYFHQLMENFKASLPGGLQLDQDSVTNINQYLKNLPQLNKSQ